MADFVRVATVGDVAPGGAARVEARGVPIALFNVGGIFYALDHACTHRGGPLSEGAVSGESVVCPWHRAAFCLKTGKVLRGPAGRGVRSYPVRVSAGDVEIDVASPVAARSAGGPLRAGAFQTALNYLAVAGVAAFAVVVWAAHGAVGVAARLRKRLGGRRPT
jgi:nitrite reductase/ring-hydroxylating ferredoxin subunit